MITNSGALYIKRYLATQVGSIGESIAVGIGDSAEIITSTTLDLEISRFDVDLVSYDFINDYVVFKAALPDDLDGTIYEVALFSQDVNEQAGEYGSRLVTTFDSATEDWSGGTFGIVNVRAGIDSLRLAPSSSTTGTATLTDLFLDFSGNSTSDTFIVAFTNNNSNASRITLTFQTDTSNFYSFDITSPSTGYQMIELPKGEADANGAADWGQITQLGVAVTASGVGAASVDFDALRLEDRDTDNPDYVMVAREVLAVPYVKAAGRGEEIEFNMKVTI